MWCHCLLSIFRSVHDFLLTENGGEECAEGASNLISRLCTALWSAEAASAPCISLVFVRAAICNAPLLLALSYASQRIRFTHVCPWFELDQGG